MKIHTFTKEEYRGCPVYFRNFQHCFEYLLVIKGEIYTTHITVIPTIINRLLYAVRVEQSEYSRQQQGKILHQLRKMAEATVDYILDKK